MHLYRFDKPIKSLYFRSFVVSVLFTRFHFKVIQNYPNELENTVTIQQTALFGPLKG